MFGDRLRRRQLRGIDRSCARAGENAAPIRSSGRTAASARSNKQASVDIIEGGFRGRNLRGCIAKNRALLQFARRRRDSAQRGLNCRQHRTRRTSSYPKPRWRDCTEQDRRTAARCRTVAPFFSLRVQAAPAISTEVNASAIFRARAASFTGSVARSVGQRASAGQSPTISSSSPNAARKSLQRNSARAQSGGQLSERCRQTDRAGADWREQVFGPMNARRRVKKGVRARGAERAAAPVFPPRPPAAWPQNRFRAFFHDRTRPPPPRCAPASIAAVGPSAATARSWRRAASAFPQRARIEKDHPGIVSRQMFRGRG